MIKLTLYSIWEQKGINISAVFLLSFVFSVQLLLCAWLKGLLNIYNGKNGYGSASRVNVPTAKTIIVDEVKKYNNSYLDFFESVLERYENVHEYARTLKRKIN